MRMFRASIFSFDGGKAGGGCDEWYLCVGRWELRSVLVDVYG